MLELQWRDSARDKVLSLADPDLIHSIAYSPWESSGVIPEDRDRNKSEHHLMCLPPYCSILVHILIESRKIIAKYH